MSTVSDEVAKFTVPRLVKRWSKIVIRVTSNEVILYLNCHEMARQKVTRIPLELVFDTASTLYIAQAGPHIQEKYDVSISMFYFHFLFLISCSLNLKTFHLGRIL